MTTPFFTKVRKLNEMFLDIIFPRHCILCQKDGTSFCASCRCKMPPDTTPMIRNTVSVWQYDNETIKRVLHNLKYRGKRALARDLAESLYDKIFETLADEELFQNPAGNSANAGTYTVIPIPIHKKRKRERGYNQSELLAKELCLLDPSLFIFAKDVLKKTKMTPSQVSLKDREKRLKNIQGSFTVKNPKKIIGKNILVIDDITTTGATLKEARQVLLKAGVKSVLCATIAH